MGITRVAFFILLCLHLSYSFGQNNKIGQSDSINKKRMGAVLLSESALYVGSMSALYGIWYSGYDQTSFHFFDDNAEWLQMDKLGHFTTSYYVGKIGYEALRWSGVDNKRSIWYGGTLGLAFLTTIEVFDGFSSEWGFSAGDMTANILGSGLFIGQQLGWKEQRIQLKWSFHKSEYSKYRPDLLGDNIMENSLKDYNGQTYWLSANIKSFIKNKDSRFPKWLNVAVGYGADGMLGGRDNPVVWEANSLPKVKRIRQFYIAPDIDISRIHTKWSTLNLVFKTIGFIKFPLPALEFNSNNKFKFHYLYF